MVFNEQFLNFFIFSSLWINLIISEKKKKTFILVKKGFKIFKIEIETLIKIYQAENWCLFIFETF